MEWSTASLRSNNEGGKLIEKLKSDLFVSRALLCTYGVFTIAFSAVFHSAVCVWSKTVCVCVYVCLCVYCVCVCV